MIEFLFLLCLHMQLLLYLFNCHYLRLQAFSPSFYFPLILEEREVNEQLGRVFGCLLRSTHHLHQKLSELSTSKGNWLARGK